MHKKCLRSKWQEAGKILYPRMGFVAGSLLGEIIIFGGECWKDKINATGNCSHCQTNKVNLD